MLDLVSFMRLLKHFRNKILLLQLQLKQIIIWLFGYFFSSFLAAEGKVSVVVNFGSLY